MSEIPNPYHDVSFERRPGGILIPEGSVPPTAAPTPEEAIPPSAAGPEYIQIPTPPRRQATRRRWNLRPLPFDFAPIRNAVEGEKAEQERKESEQAAEQTEANEPAETLPMPAVTVTQEEIAGRGLIGRLRARKVRKLEESAHKQERAIIVRSGVAASYLKTKSGDDDKRPSEGRQQWDKAHRVVPSGIPEVSVPVGESGRTAVEKARSQTDELRGKWSEIVDFDNPDAKKLIRSSTDSYWGREGKPRNEALRDLARYNRLMGLSEGLASVSAETLDERSDANRAMGRQLEVKKGRSQAQLLKDRWSEYGDITDPDFLETIADHPNLGPEMQALAGRDLNSYNRLRKTADRKEAKTIKAAKGIDFSSRVASEEAQRSIHKANKIRRRELRAQAEGRVPTRAGRAAVRVPIRAGRAIKSGINDRRAAFARQQAINRSRPQL